jgi:chromosome segregation ATPase
MTELFHSASSLSSVTHPDHDDKDEFVVQLSQVDMQQKIRAIEHRFKDRYSFLKRTYEERLESLLSQIRVCDTAVQSDAVVQQLLATAETAGFASSRAHEVVVDTLGMEREKHIAQLTEQLAECQSHLDREREEHHDVTNKMAEQAKQYRHRVAQLKDNVAVTLNELQKLETEKETLDARLVTSLQQEKQLNVARASEREIVKHARTRLQSLLAFMQPSGAAASSQHRLTAGQGDTDGTVGRSLLELVNGMERAVQTWQHDVLRTKSSLADATASTARVEEDMKVALERATSQVSELKRELEHAKKENETVKQDYSELSRRLNTCEEERRSIRQQYVELGSKLESAVLQNEESKAKALQHSQTQCEQLKSDLLAAERQVNTLKKDVELTNAKLADREEKCLQFQKTVNAFQPAQKQDRFKINQLEEQLTKYKHKVHRMKEKHKTELNALQRRLNESTNEHKRVQARTEAEMDRRVETLKAKLKAANDQVRAQERRSDAEIKREQAQQQQKYQDQLDKELRKVNHQYEIQLQQLQQQLEMAVSSNALRAEVGY